MTSSTILNLWLALFIATGIVAGVWTGFLMPRKIQLRGFKWPIFRNEILFGIVNVAVSGMIIGFAMKWLTAHGVIATVHASPTWWVIALEYAVYFFAFDHKYFSYNNGGHTTIWEWVCGTVRPNSVADFEKVRRHSGVAAGPASQVESAS